MTKSMKMVALFLALTIAQTAVISSGYADDDSAGDVNKHTVLKKHDSEKERRHHTSTDSNGVKTFVPNPVKTITPTPIQTYTPTPLPTLPTTPAPAPAKTWALYNQYCSGCHGTSKQGASAALIQTGINSISAMSSLKSLSAAQIAAIAAGQ